RLTPSEPSAAPAFLFRCHARVVWARLDQADIGTGTLTLQVALARIRSTASAPDEMLRPRSFSLLHWLARVVVPAWRVDLRADRRQSRAAAAPPAASVACQGPYRLPACHRCAQRRRSRCRARRPWCAP